jgi:CheY-like chemotaxis protein
MRRRLPRTPEPQELVTVAINIGGAAPPTASPLKILLLEDRSDYRNVLREYLISCSYQVKSVPSGIEGLREIMKARFDIILCDMMMPNMGGEMFYWAVTRVRPAARESFIFFTGHKNNPAVEFFFKRVSTRVLYKPFSLSLLDSAIQDVMRKVS